MAHTKLFSYTKRIFPTKTNSMISFELAEVEFEAHCQMQRAIITCENSCN